MRISELISMIEDDETISFRKVERVYLIKIEKYNLETKKIWSIQKELSQDFIEYTDDIEYVVSNELKYMIEEIRNANKR